MTMSMRLSSRVVATGLMATVLVSLHAAKNRWQPIGLARVGADRVIALDRSGQLDSITVSKGARVPLERVDTSGPLDLAGAETTKKDFVVLVSSFLRTGLGDVIGTLRLLPNPRTSLQSVGARYFGVALKPESPPVGFVTKGREVFQVAYADREMTTKYLGTCPQREASLGSISIDPAGNTLCFADVPNGTIWQMPAVGGTPTVFATGFREISAIAVDSQFVFVADADGRKVVVFARAGARGVARPARSHALPQFQTPRALAIVGPNSLMVGDPSAGAAFVMSIQTGQLLQTIP